MQLFLSINELWFPATWNLRQQCLSWSTQLSLCEGFNQKCCTNVISTSRSDSRFPLLLLFPVTEALRRNWCCRRLLRAPQAHCVLTLKPHYKNTSMAPHPKHTFNWETVWYTNSQRKHIHSKVYLFKSRRTLGSPHMKHIGSFCPREELISSGLTSSAHQLPLICFIHV